MRLVADWLRQLRVGLGLSQGSPAGLWARRPGRRASAHRWLFDWDRYHARQNACAWKDRIVAECARGYYDDLALRQATRDCSPVGTARRPAVKQPRRKVSSAPTLPDKQPALPLALPEQRRTHDPVPEPLVRQLLRRQSPVEAR